MTFCVALEVSPSSDLPLPADLGKPKCLKRLPLSSLLPFRPSTQHVGGGRGRARMTTSTNCKGEEEREEEGEGEASLAGEGREREEEGSTSSFSSPYLAWKATLPDDRCLEKEAANVNR